MAGWKKVGTFIISRTPNGQVPVKIGGNVVAYFLTPDLEVIHVVFGNVNANTFLEGARWAKNLADRLAGTTPTLRPRIASEAHQAMNKLLSVRKRANVHLYRGQLSSKLSQQNLWSPSYYFPVHEKLAQKALPKLDTVYTYFFEKVLGEKVSDAPVQRMDAAISPLNNQRAYVLPAQANARR